MPTTVLANNGDTLCGLAIDAGFENCQPLRDEPLNQGRTFLSRSSLTNTDFVTIPDKKLKHEGKGVDAKHKFVKKTAPKVSIRFVHGSPDKKYLDDDRLTVLNVSNFETDKAGPAGTHAFPQGKFGFDADGHADVDAFKVEVVDPKASGTLNVVLEALKPVKQADGSIQFQSITGVPDAALRKIEPLQCKQVKAGQVAFRTSYLRLVVDTPDQVAGAGQTLLTADAVDAGDETLEILEQHVRASYAITRCPATPKCTVTAELPIGENRQRAKVSIHILQDPATGTPLATVDQARKSVLKYVRQLYAQASMSVKLIAGIRTVPGPTNLIAIANANGALALGGGTIRMRVRVGKPNQATFDFDQTVQIVTTAGDAPLATATALSAAINAAFAAATPPFKAAATASDNPPLVGQAIGSADVLVGNPLTQSISLSVLSSGDAAHPVTVGRIVNTNIPDFGAADSHVGTIEERTLVKNYDSGIDRIDLFVIGTLGSTALGEAFIPNAGLTASQQPIALMSNSALVFAATVTTNDNFHTTIPHEMGHILMDNNHALVATEMMGAGSPVGANERVVNGPKRISDPVPPRTIAYSSGFAGNPVTMLRTNNPGVIDPF
jgi:hypothetical protein